ncbi:MAG: fumarate/nitrate reduction transcriptional regulator Fnr [Candidatus Polarisedimenticolaceae bacterium]|nr:fumarate/nitrate reduction transcriptional regulator Fnr [Candidatus Polarisedimenticolaceae bacterium]
MTGRNVIPLEAIKIACQNCSLSALCLPMALTPEDVIRLDSIIKRNRPLHRGDHLYSEGEPFEKLRVVTTGSVKTYSTCDDGSERILGFHLPGELIGLDAIESNHHRCSAKALETTLVCDIPFDQLEKLSHQIPSLQHQLYRLLSREIGHETEILMLLGKKGADERLATFLISLSERFKSRGFSATDFFLSMSRYDIGNYLGLAVETISRIFTRFQEVGLIQVERKHVQLLNLALLKEMADGNHHKSRSHRGCQSK